MLPLPHTGILFRNFVNQIYVAVRAAGKSRAVFDSAFGAEHDQNHIPHAIPAVSAFHEGRRSGAALADVHRQPLPAGLKPLVVDCGEGN